MRSKLKNLEELRGKPVAVLGAGVSGRGVGALLNRLEWEYITYDEQSRDFGETEARASSIVVYSPGFHPDHRWLAIARNANVKCYGEMDFGSCFLSNSIVAITGTNGKTTLTTLLGRIWKEAGKTAVEAGNIGLPLCELIARGLDPKALVFLEVSSFQAQGLKNLHPSSVLWTNFEEDHLDHHVSIEEYFTSKAQLLKNASGNESWIGLSVFDKSQVLKHELPKNVKVVGRDDFDPSFLPPDHFMKSYPQLENLSIAWRFSQSCGISRNLFERAILNYCPEPHRLEKIATFGQATFWNDSKATNTSATVAACRNFSGNLFWIGGGRAKGSDTGKLVDLVKPFVKRAYLIGEMGETLQVNLSKEGILATLCNTLKEAVIRAYEQVTEQTNILFSPGFASFDSYTNYSERGKSFVDAVFDLKKAVSGITQEGIN
jgi:UDP-N-acetylmuramoylalanine--D-glutamate ligase